MKELEYKKSPKTKILNTFRRVFTIPIFEKMLVKKLLKNPSNFSIKLIPPDYLFKSGSVRIVERKGINFKLDISNVVDHYLYWGLEYANYETIVPHIKEANVILDIGANIGVTSLYFASINPNARIIAFEPHPTNFKRLSENIGLNPTIQNIKTIKSALGSEETTMKMYEMDEHNPGNNQIIEEDINYPSVDVQIKVLDDILQTEGINKVDFIKIDVEGFEYFVLKGGLKMLKTNKPLLFIEIDDFHLRKQHKSPKEVIELLLSIGYTSFQRADNQAHIDLNTDFFNCHFDIISH